MLPIWSFILPLNLLLFLIWLYLRNKFNCILLAKSLIVIRLLEPWAWLVLILLKLQFWIIFRPHVEVFSSSLLSLSFLLSYYKIWRWVDFILLLRKYRQIATILLVELFLFNHMNLIIWNQLPTGLMWRYTVFILSLHLAEFQVFSWWLFTPHAVLCFYLKPLCSSLRR
jgi:hypothetical protein